LATFAGLASYQQADAGWVGLLDVIETANLKSSARIELFQIDKAPGYPAELALHDAQYQEEQRGRSYN
jgi:hypothetical protein